MRRPDLDRRHLLRLAALAGLSASVAGCSECGPANAGASAGSDGTLYVTTAPLLWAARGLLGGARDVVLPLTPGTDPAHWTPSRELLGRMQRAELIAVNGAGLEGWTDTAGLPRSRVVDTSSRFSGRLLEGEAVTHSHGADGDHSHAPLLPCTWVDPNNLNLQVAALADALSELEPGLAETIASGRRALDAELRAIDGRWLELSSLLAARPVHALGNSYAYLAARYRFEVSVLDPAEGWPTEGLVLIDGAEQFATHGAPREGAPDAGARAVRVDSVGTLARQDALDGLDYPSVVRRDLDALAEALGHTFE